MVSQSKREGEARSALKNDCDSQRDKQVCVSTCLRCCSKIRFVGAGCPQLSLAVPREVMKKMGRCGIRGYRRAVSLVGDKVNLTENPI